MSDAQPVMYRIHPAAADFFIEEGSVIGENMNSVYGQNTNV